MATKVRAVSCNVVRKNNPASKATKTQIRKLRAEAVAAGDTSQVNICDRALKGSKRAVDACGSVIASAAAMNPASKCGCPKKNPASKSNTEILGYERVETAWQRKQKVSFSDMPKYKPVIETVWCAKKGDTSPTHLGGKGYNSKCSWCYLGYGHTDDEHKRQVARANPIGETLKKAAKHVGKKAATKGKELGARAGAATKRAAKAAGRKAVEKGKEYGARAGAATKRVAKKAAAKGAEVGKRAAKRTTRKVAGTARGAAAGLVKGWKENPTGVYKQTFQNGDEIYFVAESQQKNKGWAGHMVRFEKGRAQKPKRTSVSNFDLWTRVTTADVPTKVLEKFGVKVNPTKQRSSKANPVRFDVAMGEPVQFADVYAEAQTAVLKLWGHAPGTADRATVKRAQEVAWEAIDEYVPVPPGRHYKIDMYLSAPDAVIIIDTAKQLAKSRRIEKWAWPMAEDDEPKENPTSVRLPSEEDGGKLSHDKDFAAGFVAGKKALKTNANLSVHDAKSAFSKVRGHGSWWTDGFIAAIDLHRGAHKHKGVQIAKRMGLVSTLKQNPASKKPSAAKRNPSKDQTHLSQHNKRWHVLYAQDWLFISDSRAKELLAMGAVKVPWSHGKMAHHAPGRLVENQALGIMLHNWHYGQNDPIYQVGSQFYANKKVTAKQMEAALSGVQSLLHDKTAKYNSAGYKELKLIENNLAERIGRAQGRQVILGEPLDNPAEVVKFPKRNPTKKPAGGIPKVQIEYIVGNIHVGEPDEVVRKNVEDRARKAGATDKLVKACGDYAVKVHQRNRNLYNDVMGGRIGSGRRRKNPAESPQARRARLRDEYPDLAAEADYHAETSPSFTKGKIGAVSITLTRTEGGNHDLNEPHHVTGKDVWGKANALLSLWGAEAAVGVRNKVKFVVHYSDKETYTGSYYVSRADKDSAHLGQHIRHSIEAVLGKRKPAHMTPKQYRLKLTQVKIGMKEKWEVFLSKYSTGRQENPSVLAPGQTQRIPMYSSTGTKLGEARRDPSRGKIEAHIKSMPLDGKVILRPKGKMRLAGSGSNLEVFSSAPHGIVRIGQASHHGKDIHIKLFAIPHLGKFYLTDYPSSNPTTGRQGNPSSSKPKAKKPRNTPEQKKALEAYNFAVQQEDRYMGSVFVTPQGQRKHEELVKAAYEKCKRLGMTYEHGL